MTKNKEFEISKEKQILNNIFYRPKTMIRLRDKIENFILEGKDLNNKVSRELQRNCHLYEEFKKVYGDPKKIIEEEWKKTSEDLNRMTPEEISSLRFFKEQQSSEEKRIKEGPKPFDEFNMSLVLAAKINKLISRKEALILKYRYNLEGHRINSLRLVAGWLGVSHTTVRNAEKRALKRIQGETSFLKCVRVKKPQRKEMSKEEYKRRFGYYPDLGKK